MKEEQTDVFLHTGNIFNKAIPSNKGLNLLSDFVFQASELPDLKAMVFICGNHDLSHFLESLNPLLKTARDIKIHFISSLPVEQEQIYQKLLVPVTCPSSGAHLATIIAFPYTPHSILLAKYTSDKKSAIDRFSDLEQSLKDIYTSLAKQAQSKFAQGPLIAMGHFNCADQETLKTAFSSHRSIYFNQKFTPELFCDSYDYIALGHNHNHLSLNDGRIQYAGSPITTSDEECTTRHVLQIEIDESNTAQVKPIQVPPFRKTVVFDGSLTELLDLLEQEDVVQTTYLYATVTQTNSHQDVLKHLEKHSAHVRLIDLKQPQEKSFLDQAPPLSMLDPEQIFSEIYTQKYNSLPSEELTDLLKQAVHKALYQEELNSKISETVD